MTHDMLALHALLCTRAAGAENWMCLCVHTYIRPTSRCVVVQFVDVQLREESVRGLRLRGLRTTERQDCSQPGHASAHPWFMSTDDFTLAAITQ